MTNAELHYKKMTETPVAKLILKLGIPTTISMLITSIYNMADTYFVGTLGESAQASTGVLFTLQAIIQGIAFMLGHGGGTFISKELANHNEAEMKSRLKKASEQNIPIVNYGMAIAYMNGILERSLEIFKS